MHPFIRQSSSHFISYRNPANDPDNQLTTSELQEHLDLFYEDLFLELSKYGEVDLIVVCRSECSCVCRSEYRRVLLSTLHACTR